jgi:hypothetical protein
LKPSAQRSQRTQPLGRSTQAIFTLQD